MFTRMNTPRVEEAARDTGDRIRQAREHAGFSQARLAQLVGLEQQTISKLERTPFARTSRLHRIAEACGVDVRWLETGQGRGPGAGAVAEDRGAYGVSGAITTWSRAEELPEGRFALVPCREVKLSCGNGCEVFTEEAGPPLAFRTDWLRKQGADRDQLVVAYAEGDSQEPYIYDGDAVLVNLADREIREGRSYAIRYGGELRIKMLSRRYDGALVLRSRNTELADEVVPAEALESGQVEILGRVIWRGGSI